MPDISDVTDVPQEAAQWQGIRETLSHRIRKEVFENYFHALKFEQVLGAVAWFSVPTESLQHFLARYCAKDMLLCCKEAWPHVEHVRIGRRTHGMPFHVPVSHAVVEKEVEEEEAAPPPLHDEPTYPQPPEQRMSEDGRPIFTLPSGKDYCIGPTQDYPKRSVGRVYIEDVIRIMCLYYKIPRRELLSPHRDRAIVRRRQVCMYLCKLLTGRGLPEIGRRLGGRDHTTVLHSVRRVEQKMTEDAEFKAEVELLASYLRTGQAFV